MSKVDSPRDDDLAHNQAVYGTNAQPSKAPQELATEPAEQTVKGGRHEITIDRTRLTRDYDGRLQPIIEFTIVTDTYDPASILSLPVQTPVEQNSARSSPRGSITSGSIADEQRRPGTESEVISTQGNIFWPAIQRMADFVVDASVRDFSRPVKGSFGTASLGVKAMQWDRAVEEWVKSIQEEDDCQESLDDGTATRINITFSNPSFTRRLGSRVIAWSDSVQHFLCPSVMQRGRAQNPPPGSRYGIRSGRYWYAAVSPGSPDKTSWRNEGPFGSSYRLRLSGCSGLEPPPAPTGWTDNSTTEVSFSQMSAVLATASPSDG